jgi:hypothetical protein
LILAGEQPSLKDESLSGKSLRIGLTRFFDFDTPHFMKSLRRKAASIAKGRWAAYATAGVASSFISANSAEATIHYSGPIHRYSGWYFTKSFRFQLDQPGDSIRLRHYVTAFTTSGSAHFGVDGVAGKGFAGFYCPSNPRVGVVSKLNRGAFISRRPFLAKTSGVLGQSIHPSCPGQFEDGDLGFIAFKFNGGSGDQYGWVRIQLDFRSSFWIVDYAYADPGEPIRAGQTSSNEMVPEEGSLGALALGAAGLLAWRKSRSRAAR